MDLKQRILKAAEFDTSKFLYNAGYDNDKPLNDNEEWCVKGGVSANLQLRPLIDALAQVVEALEGMNKLIDDADLVRNTKSDGEFHKFFEHSTRILGVLMQSQDSLANLERVVGGSGEGI